MSETVLKAICELEKKMESISGKKQDEMSVFISDQFKELYKSSEVNFTLPKKK